MCLPISSGSSDVTALGVTTVTGPNRRGDSPIYEGMGGKTLWDSLVDQARRFTRPPLTTVYHRNQSKSQSHCSPSPSPSPSSSSPSTSSTSSISNNDVARLARILLGKAVGLVLGGGGAKGMAHLGVIQALVEAGIPIDAIGGTSIGSFVGALYARDVDYYTAMGFAKQLARRLSNRWYYLLDLTYPITSWFTGHSFNRGLWKIFREKFIEDLWLNYFAVTTDIAHSRMMVHRIGFVWRYVRASMSLCGFLPPLCDRGALLVDGGYLDNVPVEVMFRQMPVAKVIAIDVGRPDESDVYDYGDTLSGLWLLIMKWLGRRLHVPTLTDIQQRLAYVSCTEKLGKLRASAIHTADVLYLHPPVENYEVMDWTKGEEILQTGYNYGRKVVEEWKQDGTWAKLAGNNGETGGSMDWWLIKSAKRKSNEDEEIILLGRRGSETWEKAPSHYIRDFKSKGQQSRRKSI